MQKLHISFGTSSKLIRPARVQRRSGPSKDVHQIADIQLPAVTFERAGTGVPRISSSSKKQTNKNKLNTVPQKISRDYSDAENINTLFDRIENAFVRPRENAREEESAQTKAPSVGAQGSEKVRPDGGRRPSRRCCRAETAHRRAQDHVHLTKAGKKLDGVIARTLTNGQATAIDPFTWPKGRRVFIRIKHVVRRRESNNETRYNPSRRDSGYPSRPCRHDMAQKESQPPRSRIHRQGQPAGGRSNRYLANALKTSGHHQRSRLTARAGGDRQYLSAQKYAAAYNLAHRYGWRFHCPRGGAASAA